MDETTTQVVVRMPVEMRAVLQADADANERSLAQTIRHLLRKQIDQEGNQ